MFATLIGHFLGSSKPPAWLFSLHCMVYVVFSLCACAWPRWGTQLQFAPPSPQQTCTSRSGFYFFLLCVFPGPHPTRSAHERCTFHTTVLCQSEICVGLRQFRAAPVAAAAAAVVAFAAVTAANATHATPGNANATDDTRPGVLICRKWYALPPQYPQNADGQLENDQAFCRQLHLEKKEDLFERCKLNPTPRGKPHKRDTKADLIFKRVFCNYL